MDSAGFWWVLVDPGGGLTGLTGSDGSDGSAVFWLLLVSFGGFWSVLGGFWWILVNFGGSGRFLWILVGSGGFWWGSDGFDGA